MKKFTCLVAGGRARRAAALRSRRAAARPTDTQRGRAAPRAAPPAAAKLHGLHGLRHRRRRRPLVQPVRLRRA